MEQIKIAHTVQISGALQSIRHYIDVVEKGRLKMQDGKMTDKNAGLQNARLENVGPTLSTSFLVVHFPVLHFQRPLKRVSVCLAHPVDPD